MTETLDPLLDWIARHPLLAYSAVAAAAFLESVIVVGLFVPGLPIMFAVGALVAAGSLNLGPTLLLAAAGAAAGDLLSFYLGRRYSTALRGSWPLRRFPGLLAQGESFFDRYGAGAVVFGRFVGAVRPIVPAIAGMAAMPVLRFAVVDVLAALAWAPVYIVPGMLFASSLGLAAEIGMRLVILLLAAAGAVYLVVWALGRLALFTAPRAQRWVDLLMHFSDRHRRLGLIGSSLADPHRPESPGLALLTVILTVIAGAVLIPLWGLGSAAVHPLDRAVAQILAGLQTPWADALMTRLAILGEPSVYGATLAAGLGYLMFSGNRAAAWHWVAALAPGLIFAFGTHAWLAAKPTMPAGYVAPLANVSLAAAVLTFLASLLARRTDPAFRWMIHAPAATLVILIALARLYLGQQWLSHVAVGLILTFIWVALLSLAYRRHVHGTLRRARLLAITVPALVLAAALQPTPEPRAGAVTRTPGTVMSLASWWHSGWAQLPGRRIDFEARREQAFDLQWAGSLAALRAAFLERGWYVPPGLTARTALRSLESDPPVDRLPVLPKIHAGRHPALILARREGHCRQEVLYVWSSGIAIGTADTPLWLGLLAGQQRARLAYMIHYPRTMMAASSGAETVAKVLQAHPARVVHGRAGSTVLLARDKETSVQGADRLRNVLPAPGSEHSSQTASSGLY